MKLFPTKLLRAAGHWNIDFTTSVAEGFKAMPEVSNVSEFNTDEFNAWKSAFRECTKLASGIIKNSRDTESAERLHTWCNVSNNVPYNEMALAGAIEGRDYGTLHQGNYHMLNHINNFKWLEDEFDKRYVGLFRLGKSRELYTDYFSWA